MVLTSRKHQLGKFSLNFFMFSIFHALQLKKLLLLEKKVECFSMVLHI